MSSGSRRSSASSTASAPEPALTKTEMLRAARGFTAAMNLEGRGLPESRRAFAVKGSMAMLAHGVDVTPGDMDVMVRNMRQAQGATQRMGYTARPSAFRQRLPREGSLPQMDVLPAQDRSPLKNTRVMSGVRVVSREELMRNLREDDRPEKRTRNEAAWNKLAERGWNPSTRIERPLAESATRMTKRTR